jgi:hypothetical protein
MEESRYQTVARAFFLSSWSLSPHEPKGFSRTHNCWRKHTHGTNKLNLLKEIGRRKQATVSSVTFFLSVCPFKLNLRFVFMYASTFGTVCLIQLPQAEKYSEIKEKLHR